MVSSPSESHRQTVLDRELDEFLIDRESRRTSPNTMTWYRYVLAPFREFMHAQGIEETENITPGILRRYIVHLSTERGYNDGGVANVFSAAKSYLNWYEAEYNPDGWTNPLRRVQSPRKSNELEQPLSAEHFRALLRVCAGNSFTDSRDRAMFYLLADSGVRRQELADLNIGDVDMRNGDVLVRSGKGGKTRITFVSAKTRKALAKYFRHRPGAADSEPLWLTKSGGRLTPAGLRQILRRRAEEAGIPTPGFHDFRRAFAINSLRSGMDLVTLQRMLGHANLNVINRYLALVGEDLRRAHAQHSPVEHLLDN